MHSSALIVFSTLLSCAFSARISLYGRQNGGACFIVGSEILPQEVADVVTDIQDVITCDASTTTLSGVPDVSAGGITFSSINFATSDQTPLDFALDEFATSDPLASTDLSVFEDMLNTYLATEAGIRSTGGNLAIKVPKFFLSFQIARIKTAQGIEITDAGQTVDHLLGKVTKNGAGEDQSLLDEVTALAGELA